MCKLYVQLRKQLAAARVMVGMGVLVGGLVLGWLRSVHPTFGRLPTPTMWFMNSVGLNVFIAIVGISAGPVFIAGLKSAGVGLLIGGVVATSLPMLLAPLIGRYHLQIPSGHQPGRLRRGPHQHGLGRHGG